MRPGSMPPAGTASTQIESGNYPPSLIFNTAAHIGSEKLGHSSDNPTEMTIACNNLAILTQNLGRHGRRCRLDSVDRPTTRA